MTEGFSPRPIRIVHNTQTVIRKIEHADERMFVREFMQNALEASRDAGSCARVKWHQFTENGQRKLYVWNNGRGMTPGELQDRMNLFVSGDEKEQSIDKNYGIGAKLTGLKASPSGVLFRSCKDGLVTQILIGYDDNDIPAILEMEDVTEFYANDRLKDFDIELYRMLGKQDCSMIDFEWTMAVFLGSSDEQDTVIDPYGEGIRVNGELAFPKGKPSGGQDYWLLKAINRRYYDLSNWAASTLIMANTAPQNRSCLGAASIKVEQEEYVTTAYGRIRYCLIPEGKGSNEDGEGTVARGILVYKNEIYDGYFGQGFGGWQHFAPQVGISAGHKRIAIDVLLNDGFPATPNEYRTAIEQKMGRASREIVGLEDFANDIELYMPEFIRQFVAAEEMKSERCSDRVDRAGREMMIELGLKDSGGKGGSEDSSAIEDGDGDARVIKTRKATDLTSSKDEGAERSPRIQSKRPYRRGKPIEPVAIKSLKDQPIVEWKDDAGSSGEIGSFISRTNKIELYRNHPVLEALTAEMLSRNIPATHRSTIKSYAEDQIGIAAIAHVLWARHLLQTGQWDETRYDAAVTPDALTASLGYYKRHLHAVADMCRSIKREKAPQ